MMNHPVSLPDPFCRMIESQLGSEAAAALFDSLQSEPPVSVRYNPYKLREGTERWGPEYEVVPWCRYGRYLASRPQFTLDPLFHAGVYYVQEAASMFLEQIFRSVFGGQQKALRVLDLCAAPGGKTTLLSTLVGTKGVVVANEVIRSRSAILADNVRRWGIGNTVVTSNDPAHFSAFHHVFDAVVVDAPCSGEGMFRKDPASRSEWSEQNVKLCAARQRRILEDVWDALRPEGILVYSTCTFNRFEDEENVAWLCERYDCMPVEMTVDPRWGIVCGEVQGIPTFRFFPGRTESEGFFVAVLRKEGAGKEKMPQARKKVFSALRRNEEQEVARWIDGAGDKSFAAVDKTVYIYDREQFPFIRQIAEYMSVIYSGVPAGQFFGADFKPDPALALFYGVSKDRVAVVDLPLEPALDYLRKQSADPRLFEEGLNLVSYEGMPLGWIKRIGNRCNNLYPKESRIFQL